MNQHSFPICHPPIAIGGSSVVRDEHRTWILPAMAGRMTVLVAILFIVVFAPFHPVDAASLAPRDVRLVKAAGDARVFSITKEGKKHHIRNMEIFRSYKYSWKAIRMIGRKELERTPFIHLAKTADSDVIWWVSDVRGLKKPHVSQAALESYGNRAKDAVVMTKEDLDAYKDVRLVKEKDDPKVYFLEQGAKRWIATEQAFRALGLAWSEIVTVSRADIESYSEGAVLDGTQAIETSPAPSQPTPTSSPSASQQRLAVSIEKEPTNQQPVPVGALRRFLAVTFKNQSATPVPIDAMTIHQIGLSDDADAGDIVLTNPDGSTIGSIGRLSDRKANFRFSGDALQIPASGTRVVHVRAVMQQSAQMGLSFEGPADISTPASVEGSFPLRSQIVSSVAGDFLPNVTLAAETVSGASQRVSIGNIEKPIAAFRFENKSTTDRALVTRLRFSYRGSAVTGDLKNIRLVDTTRNKVLGTIATIHERWAIFDLSSAPLVLERRSGVTVTIKADIVDGDGRTLLFAIDSRSDITLSTENGGYQFTVADAKFPIGGETDPKANIVTIVGGSVVITPNVKSPSGTTVIGAKNVVLAIFDVKVGETPVEWTGGSVRVRQQGAHALDGNIILREQGKTVDLATFSSAGLSETPQHFYVQRVPIVAKKTFVIEVVGTIAPTADVTDAYTVSVSDMEFSVPKSVATFTAADEVRAHAIGIKTLTLQATPNETVRDTHTIADALGRRVASLTLKNGTAETVRIKEITLKDRTGFDALSSTNGVYRVEAKIGSTIAGEVSAPSGGTISVLPTKLTLNVGASAILDVFVDTTAVADGKRFSLSLERVVAEGDKSEAVAQVFGLPVTGQVTTLHVSSLTMERVDAGLATTVAPGKAVKIGRFSLFASEAEKFPITDMTIGESPESVAVSSVQGVTNLSMKRADTNKPIGGSKPAPAAGGNALSGFTMNAGERITIDLYADLAAGLVGKTLQTMILDMRVTGVDSKKTPVIVGMPLKLQSISIR